MVGTVPFCLLFALSFYRYVTYMSFGFLCLFAFCLVYHLQIWDMRKNDVLYKMNGHMDSITGLTLSPDGSYVMSNSMDNTGS